MGEFPFLRAEADLHVFDPVDDRQGKGSIGLAPDHRGIDLSLKDGYLIRGEGCPVDVKPHFNGGLVDIIRIENGFQVTRGIVQDDRKGSRLAAARDLDCLIEIRHGHD